MSSPPEIPLLRESAMFANRLVQALTRTTTAQGISATSRYGFERRINWTFRYDSTFYARESAAFLADPEAYVRGEAAPPAPVDDVYAQRLSRKQLGVACAKVFAHWVFRAAGGILSPSRTAPIYRKAYVDDIELVFDPEEDGVLRWVYPFPLNVRRQLRYLRALRQKRRRFRLAGSAYSARDLLAVLRHRDVRSVMRLESRAAIRHAHEVAAAGVRQAQLSDEFDLGSLDFARTLAKKKIRSVNSAHGVGLYLPVHGYDEFHTVTRRQQQYYRSVRRCLYRVRLLNDRESVLATQTSPGLDVVFLSQVFEGISPLIQAFEEEVTSSVARAFAAEASCRLWYKPHPNRDAPVTPAGFRMLPALADVNGRSGTIFVSFFSTCHIDPSFKGEKILVRNAVIRPEIIFDDSETILSVTELEDHLRRRLASVDATR
jgi:hypothetical protein